MLAVIFPGQGSQFTGMGRALFKAFPRETECASEILGHSVTELCESDDRKLRETQWTQPALFVVNALAFENARRHGMRPDVAAGHSLGELNALHAAGVFGFEDGMRIAQQRGLAMAAVSEDSGHGGMLVASRISDTSELLALLAERFPELEGATFNTPSQIAFSGPRERLGPAKEEIESRKLAQCALLNVSGAFHSSYMAAPADRYRAGLSSQRLRLGPPRFPVYANVTGAPYPSDEGEIIQLMTRQLVSPVRWADCVRAIQALGPVLFVELGARAVLIPMIDEIASVHRAAA